MSKKNSGKSGNKNVESGANGGGKGVKRANRGILWRVVLVILSLIFACVLELGKHTLIGWLLTAALIAAFIILRIKVLGRRKTIVRLAAWSGMIVTFALILWISWPPVRNVPAVEGKNGGETSVIHVSQGDLTGVKTADGAVEVFAGIPYAVPPVGEMRWKEPEPAKPWEGVLKADHFAPMSMQTTNLPIYNSLTQIIGYHDYKISFTDNYRPPVSEDSLYLNIWRPAGDAKDLPVLVYVHGGSLQTGQPWYGDYSGEGLARQGVIVVNMGYRLGIFGFFADQELASESEHGTTGNYGLLDQILALKWVRDNIASFGGDPDNVTLSGESAGSACVSALCTSPLAKGLFRRVVGESSTVTAPEPAHSFRALESAFVAGSMTKKRFGAASVNQLRTVSADKLAPEMNYHHHITIDGYVLSETPYESYKKGIHNEEAIMHGFNKEEAAPFLLFSNANMKNYEQKIRAFFKEPYASRVLEMFPAASDAQAKRNWLDINTVVLFTYGHYCWERQAKAAGIPVYTYYFTKENGRLGSWHSGEEVYLYGNIPKDSNLFGKDDRYLSGIMSGYFVNFIRNGDPNGAGLPVWPDGDGTGNVLELGDNISYVKGPYEGLYEILDEMYGF